MNIRFRKSILTIFAISIISAICLVAALPVIAASTIAPDTGEANGISNNGGEWSIYANKFGQITSADGSIKDVTETKGTVEVTGTSNYGAAFQFDLSTKNNNDAAINKVIKSARLRLTPMVSKVNANQMLFAINNDFQTTNDKRQISEFAVPRGQKDDFFSDSNITSLNTDISSYPKVISDWQTAVDITGDVITEDEAVSLYIESSSIKTAKTEYATSNTERNGRLNSGKVPFLYSNGVTDFTKWVYPQIIFEYTDKQNYKDAYDTFVTTNKELSGKKVTETENITLTKPKDDSVIKLEIYGDINQPATIGSDGESIVFNSDYVGNESYASIKLTVTNTYEEETASYSRVICIPVDYVRLNTISFDTEKNSKGVVTVKSGNKTYDDGTAYAKSGSEFTVNGGANTGYTAKITVTDINDNIISQNENGTFTMPDTDVKVSVSYLKKIYGTTGIAANNSISIKADGSVQGNTSNSNLVIGAGRLTFVKFDLSEYNKEIMSEISLSFSGWNTPNTKAIFFVPNNNWSESTFSKDFCIDGTETTKLSAFTYGEGASISLLNGENRDQLIIPNSDGTDLSNASNGILSSYYLGCSSTETSDSIEVTDAIKKAMEKSNDGIITLMVYSLGGGRDVNSVLAAPSLEKRPSLLITTNAESIPDSELVTEISSIDDLEKFAELVSGGKNYSGKTVTLKTNLDLSSKYNAESQSWQPIGIYDSISGTQSFDGIFDGSGYAITGLYINEQGTGQGLFGTVNGDITNLTVDGAINGSSVIGGIAGYSSGKITNCHSRVNIVGEREAGGIVGTLSNGGVIENCDNTGNITVKDKETYAGGISAHAVGAVINNSNNSGNITNESNGFLNKIGGLVGYLDDSELQGCYNIGEVKSVSAKSTYVADTTKNYVGGIIGYGQKARITYCYNNGLVSNLVDYAGGIAGYLHSQDVVSKCYNTGNIIGKGYIGGIVGNNNSTVSDCYNTGNINGIGEYVGGTVGYMSTGEIKNCYNTGSISGTTNIGGTYGFKSTGLIHDCYYLEGNIDSTDAKDTTDMLTADEFKNEDSFVDWDFETIWKMGESAPILREAGEAPLPTTYKIIYNDDGNAVVTVPTVGEYMVVFVAYDEEDTVTDIDIQDITAQDIGDIIVVPGDFEISGAKMVKVMLWNNPTNINPLCNAYKKML